MLQTHSSAFIESALAPAKYALFQLLGAAVLQVPGYSRSPSYTISAKIGAFGGIIVTIFYLMLVLTGNIPDSSTTASEDDVNELRNPGQSVVVLVHEMLYSTFASIIGCMAYTMAGPHPVDLPMHAFSGCVGPVMFLLSLFVIVGTTWCIAKAQKRALDWYAGY